MLREGLMTNDEHLEFIKGFTELTKSLVKLEPKEPKPPFPQKTDTLTNVD